MTAGQFPDVANMLTDAGHLKVVDPGNYTTRGDINSLPAANRVWQSSNTGLGDHIEGTEQFL